MPSTPVSGRPTFGTLFQVTHRHGQPQHVNSRSIYSFDKIDPELRDDLITAASRIDKQHGKDAHADKYGEYTYPKVFVHNQRVYVATGDEASQIDDYNSGHVAFGLYGKHPATVLRKIEASCSQILNIPKLPKMDLPFRTIQNADAATSTGRHAESFISLQTIDSDTTRSSPSRRNTDPSPRPASQRASSIPKTDVKKPLPILNRLKTWLCGTHSSTHPEKSQPDIEMNKLSTRKTQ